MNLATTTLGEHIVFSNGRSSPDRGVEGAHPVYGSNGLIGYCDQTNSPPGTIIIGRVGSYCGSLHFSKQSSWVTDNAIKAVALVPTKSRYWYFALQTFNLHGLRNGSGQPLINQTSLKAVELSVLSPQSRLEIGDLLGALDDKIELNRRMNETLEGMAQAIFRDWFVDFGPTRRKLALFAGATTASRKREDSLLGATGAGPKRAGIPDPVEIMGGLVQDPAHAAKLAALFPDAIGDNGLPEGWVEGTLGNVSILNPESWNAKTRPLQVEYVDLANTKWGTIEAAQVVAGEAIPSRAQRILRPGDTIVGTVRPGNGSYAYVGRDGLTGSSGFAVLRPKRPELREFVTVAATMRENIERLSHPADGGAYPAVRPEAVLATSVPMSSEKIVNSYHDVCGPMIERIEGNKRENRTLAATRDLLLPKLMSGEIRLRDAEAIAEAAT